MRLASVRASPSAKAEVTGKKIAMVAITTFEATPKPNHSASSGAIAKTGIAWLTTRTGRSRRRLGGRKLIASAKPAPTSGAEREPDDGLDKRGNGVDAPEIGPRGERLQHASRPGQQVVRNGEDDDGESARARPERPRRRVRARPSSSCRCRAVPCGPTDRSSRTIRRHAGATNGAEFPSLRRHDPDQVRRVRPQRPSQLPLRNTPRNGAEHRRPERPSQVDFGIPAIRPRFRAPSRTPARRGCPSRR